MISDSSDTFSMNGEDHCIRDVILSPHSSKPSDLWTIHSWTVVNLWCTFLQMLSQANWKFCHDIRFGSCKRALAFSKNPSNVPKSFACLIFAPKNEVFFVNFPNKRGILDLLIHLCPLFAWRAIPKPNPAMNVLKVVIEGAIICPSKHQAIKFCRFMLKLMNWLHQNGWILEMTDNSSCLNGWFFSKSAVEEISTTDGATAFPIPSAPAEEGATAFSAPSAPPALPQYDPFAPPSYEEATKMSK